MARKSRLGRLASQAAGTATRAAGPAAAKRASRAGTVLRRMGRRDFACHCGCGKQWSDYRLWNAHYLARNGGYWAGKGGRAMYGKMGKGRDNIRRVARGGLESLGHVNRTGKRTHRDRTKPELPASGRFTRDHGKNLRDHGRDHDRADNLDRQAREAAARKVAERERDLHHQAALLRNRHPERERKPAAPARPAPDSGRVTDLLTQAARTAKASQNGKGRAPRASANGNGHESRPVPHLTHLKRQAAPARTPPPVSRPASSRTPNGTRPVRTWTTRSPR